MTSRQAQRIRVPSTSDNHPYHQGTLPSVHSASLRRPKDPTSYHFKCTGSIRGNPCPLDQDDGFTDEAFTDPTYYEYFDDDHGYQTSPNKGKDYSRTDFTYSEDDSSRSSNGRPPVIEYVDKQEKQTKRHSRHLEHKPFVRTQTATMNSRRVYPNLPDPRPLESFRNCTITDAPASLNPHFNRRSHFSRMSSHSLGEPPSAVIDGCGGKCQTFENVCYYFLQVAFTMGILIGISLAIAGWVLRKSAARNLQVLLYIGALLSIVSALLLGIQCNARKSARLKRRILLNKTRGHIQMDLLPPGGRNAVVQRQPVVLSDPRMDAQRVAAHSVVLRDRPEDDRQGIPWWRRKDIY